MLKIFIIFLLYFIKDAALKRTCRAENKYPWSYHGTTNGPSKWGDLFLNCKNMDQFPIDIKEKNSQKLIIKDVDVVGFDQPITKAKVENLGWTVMITPEDGVKRSLKCDFDTFNLINFRFHFGTKKDPGSENVLEGVRYPMEIQFFARQEMDNFPIIFSILLDVDDNNNPGFDAITEVLPDILYRNDSTNLRSDLNLSYIIPKITTELDYFYFYTGFKPIPPCDEDYYYWILKDLGKIGSDQLGAFMSLYSVEKKDASKRCLMGQNYRPVQSPPNFQDRVLFSAPSVDDD